MSWKVENCRYIIAEYIFKTSSRTVFETSSRLFGDQRMFPQCTDLGILKAGKVKQKEELETMLKWENSILM